MADAKDWGTEPGSSVVGWKSNGGANQQWMTTGDIHHNWVGLVNRNSGLCLDTTGDRTDVGTPLQQWTCNNGQNQRFRLTDGHLVEQHSGRPVVLNGDTPGSQLVLGDISHYNYDKWDVN
ncbi:RICIN domain-containing protein [Streptomyces sp. TRM72054]|uniref:RICIN domain-containing protein n=1 Tax=Streptomyces sp. TRM72054 TaxID=2870562 RepID=UPI001C8B7A7A|nr:RICIN domain-containing protein [Streptomyces sp. TRM72054]MBX9399525.1 RICIN domain-containing protein [Streptomyces sp. TRM72054]